MTRVFNECIMNHHCRLEDLLGQHIFFLVDIAVSPLSGYTSPFLPSLSPSFPLLSPSFLPPPLLPALPSYPPSPYLAVPLFPGSPEAARCSSILRECHHKSREDPPEAEDGEDRVVQKIAGLGEGMGGGEPVHGDIDTTGDLMSAHSVSTCMSVNDRILLQYSTCMDYNDGWVNFIQVEYQNTQK